jgi:hypothetical protein
MGHTAELDDPAILEQGLVPRVVVDQEMTAPPLEEVGGMPAGAAHLIIEHHDRGVALQIIAAIGPEIRPLGLALPRGEWLYRGLIGVEYRAQAL